MNSFSSIVTVSNFKTAGRAMLVLALFMMSVFASSYSFAGRATGTPIRKEASSAAATNPATVAAAAPVTKSSSAATTTKAKAAGPTRKAKAVTTSAAAAPAAAPPVGTPAAAAATAPKQTSQIVYGGAATADPTAMPRYLKDQADAACAADKTSSECKEMQNAWRNSLNPGGDRKCERVSSSFTDTLNKLSEACSALGSKDVKDCYQKAGYCANKDSDFADESYDEDNDGTDQDGETCDKMLANRCPHLDQFMDGRDYRQEEKDSERDRKDAKKDVDDLLEDQQKLQSEQIKMKQELQEELQNAARSRTRKSQEILDRAKSDKENLSESTRKAMEDARSVYNQMDAKYIELRDKARRSTSNVRRAQDQLQATCRAAASANYTKAEAARLAAQKQGKRNVGSATGMAGGSKRKAAKDVRARNADYVAFFNECTGGVSPEGRSALNAINKAADDLKDEEQLIADQSALIEKQRLDVLQKLKEMEASVPQKEQKIIEAMNQELKNLDEDYNLAVQQANQKANSAQQETSSKMMMIQNKLAEAQREMGNHAKESMLAKRRQLCLGRAGKGNDSKKEKRNSAGNSIAGYGRSMGLLCGQLKGCDNDSQPVGFQDACVDYSAESKIDPFKRKTKK